MVLPTSLRLSQGTGVPVTERHWDLLVLLLLSAWASVQQEMLLWLWSACLGMSSRWKEGWYAQSRVSSAVWLGTLPGAAQPGKAGSSCWERPWGGWESHIFCHLPRATMLGSQGLSVP